MYLTFSHSENSQNRLVNSLTTSTTVFWYNSPGVNSRCYSIPDNVQLTYSYFGNTYVYKWFYSSSVLSLHLNCFLYI